MQQQQQRQQQLQYEREQQEYARQQQQQIEQQQQESDEQFEDGRLESDFDRARKYDNDDDDEEEDNNEQFDDRGFQLNISILFFVVYRFCGLRRIATTTKS